MPTYEAVLFSSGRTDAAVKVTGITMVRNEADIIRVTLAYHLAAGCDEILVIDNGSEDGTR